MSPAVEPLPAALACPVCGDRFTTVDALRDHILEGVAAEAEEDGVPSHEAAHAPLGGWCVAVHPASGVACCRVIGHPSLHVGPGGVEW